MDTQEQAANPGLARPPIVYAASILIGLLLQLGLPLPLVPSTFASPLGVLLVLAAVAQFAYAVRKFRAAGTPVPGNLPTTVIVRTGAYRFSRNPIYVAFSIFQLGIAFWVNSIWLVATLVAAIAVMAAVVIPREERYLETKFGADYVHYKRSVRRWL
jgi:protein-S-isoprenylcysteine O-methyltransferase Ste14